MKKKILTFLVTLGVILLPLTANASLIDELEFPLWLSGNEPD